MKLDQVCTIASEVYFEVVDHLGLYDVMIEEDPEHEGSSIRCTRDTKKGEELYYLIEETIKNAVNYKEENNE
jgi:hypothetical protein